MAIGTTILVFAVFLGLLYQDKLQVDKLSYESSDSAAVPANPGNGFDPAATLGAANTAPTNLLAPLPPPVSVTDSNQPENQN